MRLRDDAAGDGGQRWPSPPPRPRAGEAPAWEARADANLRANPWRVSKLFTPRARTLLAAGSVISNMTTNTAHAG